MTPTDLLGHSPVASLFKCDFSHSYAADDKIAAVTEHRAVPLPTAQSTVVQLLSSGVPRISLQRYKFN